jgi:hypothetical protein
MMPTSSFSAPSTSSSGVVFPRERFACSMSQPMKKNRMPPVILNAWVVIPKKRRIAVPRAAKTNSTIIAVSTARRTVRRLWRGG